MRRQWTNRATGIALTLSVGGAFGGCAPSADFRDPEPASRLAALREAVEAGDRSAIPGIITLLDSDDAAVRLFAILALEEMTGQNLGYDYAAPEAERRAAADRWEAWYRAQSRGESGDRGFAGGQSARP